MLPTTTRSYPSRSVRNAVFSLGSSVSPFLLPAYSTWSPAGPSRSTPSPSSSSHCPRPHQRRSIAIPLDPPHAHDPPPYPSISSLLERLRGASHPRQAEAELAESSQRSSRALERESATSSGRRPPRPPELSQIRRYSPELREVIVDGKPWNQRTIVEAYAVVLPESDSREGRALSRQWAGTHGTAGSTGNLVDSLSMMESVAAGVRLRDVLYKLDIDDSLFLSWRDVLLTADVRDALAVLQSQTSPASMSAAGDPLWPPWMIEIVLDRTATSLDAHLGVALMAHHLPHLPPTHQADVLLQTLANVVGLELLAAVPELVHLALASDPVRGVFRATDTSNRSSPSAVAGSSRRQTDQRSYYRILLQILAHFPSSARSSGVSAHPVVSDQIRRVLAHMLDCAIPLHPHIVSTLCRPRFLADDALKDLLTRLVHESGLKLGVKQVDALLMTAVDQDQPEVASQCMDVLDGLRSQVKEPKVDLQPRDMEHRTTSAVEEGSSTPTHSSAPALTRGMSTFEPTRDSEPSSLVYEALVVSEEDATSGEHIEYFSSSTVHFLQGLKHDLPTALTYLSTLRIPTRSSPIAHAKSLPWVASAFATLAKILAMSTETVSTDDLLRALDQSELYFGTEGQRGAGMRTRAVQQVMKGMLKRGEVERVFDLWGRVVEGREGGGRQAPNVGMLEGYLWACQGYKTIGEGIKMMDRWAFRPGLHQIVPSSSASTSSLDRSHRLVTTSDPTTTTTTTTATTTTPVIRVQLDPSMLSKLITTLSLARHDHGRGLEISFRLWDASHPRWGVTQSIDMLESLLRAAARVKPSEHGQRTREVREWETRKGGERLVPMDMPGEDEVGEDEGVDWSVASVERFFALPPARAEAPEPDMWGLTMTGSEEEETELWLRAKTLFETILSSNFPFLSTIPHPFDDLALPTGVLPPTLYTPTQPLGPHPNAEALRNPTPYLPPPSLYSHLHPTSDTFHAYLRLLVTQQKHPENGELDLMQHVPFVFGWMRHLGVWPQWRSLVLALAAMEHYAEGSAWRLGRESRGAAGGGGGGGGGGGYGLTDRLGTSKDKDKDKRDLRNERDAQMMRWWLEEWLGGEENVPGEGEVRGVWEGMERAKRRMMGSRGY